MPEPCSWSSMCGSWLRTTGKMWCRPSAANGLLCTRANPEAGSHKAPRSDNQVLNQWIRLFFPPLPKEKCHHNTYQYSLNGLFASKLLTDSKPERSCCCQGVCGERLRIDFLQGPITSTSECSFCVC